VKWKVAWTRSAWEVFDVLPEYERNEILGHLNYLSLFPYMYPVRAKGRRFRRHRWFHAGNWLVYYRVAGGVVYIRGLWPARIP
jgi:hypothetical protein